MQVHIRRLGVDDAAALIDLRREALERHPLAFGASIEDDRGLSLDFVQTALADARHQAVFGGFESATLIGMVGVVREARIKRQHTALIWGMYVTTQAREKGLARTLLGTAISHARTWPGVDQVHLSVTDPAIAARKLYEAAGFRCWGREPRALEWHGQFADELHLVLDLRGAAGDPSR